MFVFPKREIPKKNPPPDSLSHWQRVLKDPGCELLVTPAFSSQPTRCQVPMMVGMMVCAVVVVCAEDHNVILRFSRESVLYPTTAAGVNEFALVSIALVVLWLHHRDVSGA
jgi:hypothetical protein